MLRPPATILPSHLAQSYTPNPLDPLCTYHNDHRWPSVAPSGVPTMATTSLPSTHHSFNQSNHDILQQSYQQRSTLSGLNQQLAQTPQVAYQSGYPSRDMPISSSPTLQDLQCNMPNGGEYWRGTSIAQLRRKAYEHTTGFSYRWRHPLHIKACIKRARTSVRIDKRDFACWLESPRLSKEL